MFLNVSLEHFLILSSMLLVLGVIGIVLNRRNIIAILMCLELILLAVNINFVAFSRYLGEIGRAHV